MDVDAAETRHVEDCLGQDQPVGGDNHHIGTDGAHALLGNRILQGQWLEHRNAMLLGKALDRRGLQRHAAAGRPVRLRQDEGHFVPGRKDGRQSSRREFRRTGENQLHGRGLRR